MRENELFRLLEEKGQTQVLRYWDALDARGRARLADEIRSIPWEIVRRPATPAEAGEISPISALTCAQIEARREEFSAAGFEAIKSGKVAAVLLAGGQGTRLGSSRPKGMFDIGLTRPLPIFGQLIRNLQAVTDRAGAFVPLFVMTSEKNYGATRKFFKQHEYFGYPREYVRFFRQEMAPCVDFGGKLLLEGKDRLALSPNGNGGWYSSLVRSGILRSFRGLEWFNVFAVDNVLQRIADPVFLGAVIQSGMPCGAKVVRKVSPEERVGVLCKRDGKPSVVEYYELSEEMANARDAEGGLLYGYGVILNYLFRADRLREIGGANIPVHVVEKKIPCLDGAGRYAVPTEANGYKFETLILDMVRLMGDCLPFEVEREREFAPVKNRTGTDSVDTARALLQKNGVIL